MANTQATESEQERLIVYAGETPPADAAQRAAAQGQELVPILPEAAELEEADASAIEERTAKRLRTLQPDGLVMSAESPLEYLSATIIDAAPGLEIVSFLGPSLAREDYTRFMDLEHLSERGIPVTAAPGSTTISVAESTVALMLALYLDLVPINRRVKAGDFAPAPVREPLLNAVLGIVGMGSIGQRVARLARGLGMRLIYHSRRRKWRVEDELAAEFVPLGDLFARADYVSIHTTAALTRGLIDRALLARGSDLRLINTATASVVEAEALLEALEAGWVRSAAFDSLYRPPYREKFLALDDDRFLVLPFISWNTPHSRRRGWQRILASQTACQRGGPVPHQLRAAPPGS